jgi:hypothetical protein
MNNHEKAGRLKVVLILLFIYALLIIGANL